MIDLRSDTVTRPTAGMLAAISQAEVGDDVYGDDPSVNALEAKVAALLGKEAALFVPSGTMANQLALWLHAQPGDEILVGEGAHVMFYEMGAGAALSGIQLRELPSLDGKTGIFDHSSVERELHLGSDPYAVPTKAVAIENTHNRGGGRIFPQEEIVRIAEVTRRHSIKLHLDGARLWNVHVAKKISLRDLAAPFDTVSVCLSKGLGAPVGSVLLCSSDERRRAHRRRKMLGGGMRQAGILAAAGLWALEHHMTRLEVDHQNAREFANRLASCPGIVLNPNDVETNIVIWATDESVKQPAAALVAAARKRGLLLNPVGENRFRAVTHLDVDKEACAGAAEIVLEVTAKARS